MNEIFSEFIGSRVTVYLKTGRRFSGLLIRIKSNFMELNDRYVGKKLIALDVIENIERWRR